MKLLGWKDLCVDLMRESLHYDWGDISSMRKFEELSPHAVSVVEYAYCRNCHDLSHRDSLVSILNTLGFGYRYGGMYELSYDCYKKVLSLQEDTLSKMSNLRATLYYNLAWLCDKLNDIDSAIDWYLKDLCICEAVHGREGISTAHTYNSLGTVYEKKHDYRKALSYLKRALYIFKRELGEKDISVSVVCNNIASVYARKKQYEQAIRWHKKDLEICEVVHGVNHPETAISYNNIGMTCHGKGEHLEALNWYAKTIAIRSKMLGFKHPDFEMVVSQAHLAYTSLQEQKQPFESWLSDVLNN